MRRFDTDTLRLASTHRRVRARICCAAQHTAAAKLIDTPTSDAGGRQHACGEWKPLC